MKKLTSFVLLLALLCTLFGGCIELDENPYPYESSPVWEESRTESESASSEDIVTADKIPAYAGNIYVVVNQNQPYFTKAEITDEAFEFYSDLDSLGRCGYVMACIGRETMPPASDERGEIGHVRPSGWVQAQYDIVDGGYLYNRSHLIGWQLTAEDDTKENLITGTRYFNVQGMLPFESMVADYIKETGNHVLYRVTPLFEGDDLVCRGVLMEAYSVEDAGEDVTFCVFVYNVQPGIYIDYSTGESRLATEGELPDAETDSKSETGTRYILNVSSKRFHRESCSSVSTIKDTNKGEYVGDRQDLIDQGYQPCGSCNP